MDAMIFTLIVTVALAIAFYVGRWRGIKSMMNRIEEELEKNETQYSDDEQPK